MTDNKLVDNKKRMSFFFSKLRLSHKLTIPYFLLIVFFGIVVFFLVNRLTGESLNDRYYTQLITSAESSGLSFREYEKAQLELIRTVIHTKGVNSALVEKDQSKLANLVNPIKINSGLESLIIINKEKKTVLYIDSENKIHQNASFKLSAPEVDKVLSGKKDKFGDKYFFLSTPGSNFKPVSFLTVGPIKLNKKVIGAAICGNSLNTLTKEMKNLSMGEITFFTPEGDALASTFPADLKILDTYLEENLDDVKKINKETDYSMRQSIEVNSSSFDQIYYPIIIRDENQAIVGVAINSSFLDLAKKNTIQSIIPIIILILILLVFISSLLARYLAKPIVELVDIAKQAATGDLTRRANVKGNDEISILAKTFNYMSDSLKKYTDQLQGKIIELSMLYDISKTLKDSLDLESINQSINEIFKNTFKANSIMLVETNDGGKHYQIKIADNIDGYSPNELINKNIMFHDEFYFEKPVKLQPNRNIEFHLTDNGHKKVNINSPFVLPLIGKTMTAGYLFLSDLTSDNGELYDSKLLATISSEIAIAIENAGLYQDVKKRLGELSSLQEVGEVMTTTLNMDKVIRTIIKKAIDTVNAEGGVIITYEEDSKDIQDVNYFGSNSEEIVSFLLSTGEYLFDTVKKEKKPLLFDSERLQKFESNIQNDIKFDDLIIVPINLEGDIIGAIAVYNKNANETFDEHDVKVLQTISSQAAISIRKAFLYQKLENLFMNAVQSLASAIDEKDTYTRGHSERVTKYSLAIADELGMSHKDKENLKLASLLHDIGKIGIPENILQKPSSLDFDEKKIINQHPLKGVKIMEPILEMESIIPGMLYHHEHYDGTGYPSGLAGEKIPLNGRIIAVADSFDAMTSDRSYRSSMTIDKAIKELLDNTGTQFDPLVVQAFMRAFKAEKINPPQKNLSTLV